ncbi:MAG: hypothetical protein N2053_02115, partial [Chitinispirillaceae bacterium]|nr:hypothetical protein [Chitinispirillaceae bacterium]
MYIGLPQRKTIRLNDYDYSRAGYYFITICTHNRECLFGEIQNVEMKLNDFGTITKKCWQDIPLHYPNVTLDEFIIMPNHIHGVIIINENDIVGAIHELPLQDIKQRRLMTLPKIIGHFKMNVGKHINQLRNTPGIPVWQRNYYEHIIRNEKSLFLIRKYIRENPIIWGNDCENHLISEIQDLENE